MGRSATLERSLRRFAPKVWFKPMATTKYAMRLDPVTGKIRGLWSAKTDAVPAGAFEITQQQYLQLQRDRLTHPDGGKQRWSAVGSEAIGWTFVDSDDDRPVIRVSAPDQVGRVDGADLTVTLSMLAADGTVDDKYEGTQTVHMGGAKREVVFTAGVGTVVIPAWAEMNATIHSTGEYRVEEVKPVVILPLVRTP